MADGTRITDYDALTSVDDGDFLVIVDVSDTTMSADGTTKKITVADLGAGGGGGSIVVTAADDSIVIGGTDDDPTVATGTLDVIATQHPPAGSVPMNGHKHTGLSHGSVTGDSVAFDQLGTAAFQALADIAPADLAAVPGNPGPGSALSLTPAGLMTWSPYPDQFHLDSYGGTGDGQVLNDVAMSNGSANATSASGGFARAAAGMRILVSGAGGAAGTHLCTTIQTVNSATSVTLAATASAAVTAAIACYGTNNLAAANAQLAAAYTWWQAHFGATRLVVDPLVYAMAGSPVLGGSTLGNAMIPLPAVSPVGPKFLPQWEGALDVTPLTDFEQTMPQAVGAIFACLSQNGTSDGTFGPTYMIGGPIDGYGGEPGLFNNVVPSVRGLGLLLPWNTSIGGFDWLGEAGAVMENWAVMPLGVVASGPSPSITSPGSLTNTWAIAGVRMPCAGNNDDCRLGHGSAEGLVYGCMPSEHTVGDQLEMINCITGIEFYSGISSMVHAARIGYASVESCINGVGVFDEANCDIGTLDIENLSNVIRDTGSALNGYIGLRGDIGAGYNASSLFATGAGGAQLKVVNLNNSPGPVATPHAVPSSGSPWLNGYYRDAWITLAATAITALSIDATAQKGLAGSPASYGFFLPAGHSYTPTYTGTLTHTVTLL